MVVVDSSSDFIRGTGRRFFVPSGGLPDNARVIFRGKPSPFSCVWSICEHFHGAALIDQFGQGRFTLCSQKNLCFRRQEDRKPPGNGRSF
jgi:hypothetical protein